MSLISGRWIRCQSPVPAAVGELCRSPAVNTARVVGIAIGILVEVAGLVLLVPPAYYLIPVSYTHLTLPTN